MRLPMLPALLVLSAGCRTADPGVKRDPTETTSTSAPAPPDSSRVTVTLSSSTLDADAKFAEAGGFDAPSIMLTLAVKNGSSEPITLDRDVVLVLEGERAKKPESPRISLAKPITIAAGATESIAVEAGKQLVDVAAHYMKGDVLHVKAHVSVVTPAPPLDVTSNEVVIHVFVPEG